MRVLGIDPGYDRCGIAIAERDNNGKQILIFSGCITPPKGERAQRLGALYKAVADVIQKHSPTHVAIEKVFFSNNQKTALAVAEARGALLSVAAEKGLPVSEYTPQEIKLAMTGYGASSKQQVADMVSKLVSVRPNVEHDDEFDAIAIALTELATKKRLG